MNVYVCNESSVLGDSELLAALPAFQTFAGHVSAAWGRSVSLKLVARDALPADSWQILVLDDADQAGALGYHDFTPGGKPIAKVFAKTDRENGYSWSVTLTHELAEMMADPWIAAAMQTSNARFYALELGDPVEADALGYKISHSGSPSVLCSDFVLPNWFIPGSSGQFDHAGHCSKPLQLLPGGYASIFVSGRGWTQINDRGKRVTVDQNDPRFRDRSRKGAS